MSLPSISPGSKMQVTRPRDGLIYKLDIGTDLFIVSVTVYKSCVVKCAKYLSKIAVFLVQTKTTSVVS